MENHKQHIGGENLPGASLGGGSLPVRSRSKEIQHADRRSGTVDRRSGRGRGPRRRLELSSPLDVPLLNADEAAQLLHVPRSTLYELVRSRHLPHVRLGRSLRFTREQLARWVDENTFR